jgi:hypothetical protein
MYLGIYIKYPLLLSDFNFRDRFSKNAQLSKLLMHLEGVELFHADGRTDGRTDGHDEDNSLRSFANTPKN